MATRSNLTDEKSGLNMITSCKSKAFNIWTWFLLKSACDIIEQVKRHANSKSPYVKLRPEEKDNLLRKLLKLSS